MIFAPAAQFQHGAFERMPENLAPDREKPTMTVLQSVQAFFDLIEEVDPHLEWTPTDVLEMNSAHLAAQMMQEFEGADWSPDELRTELEQAHSPLAAARIVLVWIQMVQARAAALDDLAERRLAERPSGELEC